MKIILMLLAALLATGAATAQAQDGSERSWQYNAEFRAAQKELREKRLQKQQLEAQAQKTDRSEMRRAQERQRLSSLSPSNTLVLFGLLLWTVLRRQSWRYFIRRRAWREEGGMVASDQPPSPLPAYPCNARGRWLRRSAAGAGLAWSRKSKSSSAKRPPSTPRSRAAAESSLKRRSPISPSRVA